MTVNTEVDAGTCGFHTGVRAVSEDSQHVVFDIASTCEKIRGLTPTPIIERKTKV